MDTEKRKTFLINLAYLGAILILAYVVLRYGLGLAVPFVIAFFIAYFLKKPIRFLREKVHLPGKMAPIVAVILFYGIIGALLVLIGVEVISWLVAMVGRLPAMYETHIQPFFMTVLLNIENAFMAMEPSFVEALDEIGTKVIQSMGNVISNASVKVMGVATDVATAIPGLFIKLVLMIVSSFFIAIDYERLTGFCYRQMNDKVKTVFLQIKEYLTGTLWICIRSYALIMSITFVELWVGLSLLKVRQAILVALCISVFDILPVLGTGGVLIPWAILTFIQGNLPRAIGLLVIYLVIIVIRNIIEPKLVGNQLGLHPVVTLCSMFVGAQLFGVLGLFGFPIGLSLLRYLNDHGVIRIFK